MKRNSGFSLIELSIVLIIIGLLVAGITGGASLIKSAELRAIMSEVSNYRVAVNTHLSLRDSLPGDYNRGTTKGGNANDQIQVAMIVQTSGLYAEGARAWDDLVDIKAVDARSFLDSDATQNSETDDKAAYSATNQMGKTRKAEHGWIMGYYDNGGSSSAKVAFNAIALTQPITTVTKDSTFDEHTTNGILNGSLSSDDCITLDIKTDDGAAASGNTIYLQDGTNYTPIFKVGM